MKKLICLFSLLLNHLLFCSCDLKILIVGAGPCGLAMAKALQNKGFYPDIIEKENHVRSDGAGIAIPANGSWALSQLGIDLSAAALLIDEMQFTDDQGEVLVHEKINKIHPNGAQFYSLNRNELVKVLQDSLNPQTTIRTSTIIKNFIQENDYVKVEFSDGEVRNYDFVIGCDGVHSKLRKTVYPEELPEFLGLLVWRTVIKTSEDVVMPTYMLGSDRIALLYPLPNQQVYVYGHIFQSKKNPPLNTFATEFASFGGLIPKICEAIDSGHFYIHHMEKSHSVRFKLEGFSRILLVGDASHAFGPMLQNGAAQAFEDAYVLQDLLKETIQSRDIPKIIDNFEKRRLKRVETIFSLSNAKIQAISDPSLISGRNEFIKKNGAPNVNGFKFIMQQNP